MSVVPNGFTSIAQFCSKGNELAVGMDLLIELSRTKLMPATLVTWYKDKDENDPRNFGYYVNSKVTVKVDGIMVDMDYPFSMTYIKLREKDKK